MTDEDKKDAETPEAPEAPPEASETTPAADGEDTGDTPYVNIELKSALANVKQVGENVFDVYPAIPRQLTLTNGASAHLPLDVKLTIAKGYALLMPHPATVRKLQVYPEVIVGIVPAGVNDIKHLTVVNRNYRAMIVTAEQPIARLVVQKGTPVNAVFTPFETEPEEEAA